MGDFKTTVILIVYFSLVSFTYMFNERLIETIKEKDEIIKYMKHQDELQCNEVYELKQKGW